jgi:flagellar basal body-associated protein FliL
MKKSKAPIIIVILVVIIAALGGAYWYMGHSVAKRIPGNTYRYQSVSKDKTLYVTFAASGNEVVVNPDKNTAVKAAGSQTAFDQEYKSQSESATWRYSAQGGTMTLAEQTKDGKVSQWQYNKIFATGSKFTSHSFTYQIAKAGQGQVSSKTVFEKVN